jgi:multiple sugar transport system ATP-binding protein
VLLFDEPLSNLDAKLRASLRRELKELHAQLGATMVYVTHDQVEAMTLATRIAVMKSGSIQQIASPAEVYGRPANMYVAGFLGSPTINFVRGRLSMGAGGVRFMHPSLTLDVSAYAFGSPPQDGQDVVLGIRPEDIALNSQAQGASLSARVRLVEPMGSNQVLWLGVGELDLGAIAEPGLVAPVGSELHAQLDASRVSLFDATSEKRL